MQTFAKVSEETDNNLDSIKALNKEANKKIEEL